jgi:hypothetical protein
MVTEHPRLREQNYRRVEASQYLRETYGLSYTAGTLAKLAVVGGGPPFHSGGRFPLYPQSGLDDWARYKLGPLVRSTSESRAPAHAGAA